MPKTRSGRAFPIRNMRHALHGKVIKKRARPALLRLGKKISAARKPFVANKAKLQRKKSAPTKATSPMRLRSGRAVGQPLEPRTVKVAAVRAPAKSKSAARGGPTLRRLKELTTALFVVNRAHLKSTVHREADVGEIAKLPPLGALRDIAKATKFSTGDLQVWFGGGWAGYSAVKQVTSALDTLRQYCETQPDAKRMLQVVIAAMRDRKCDPGPVLLLLASHSLMCNVQKEIGVRMAFAAVTGTTAAEARRRGFEAHVLRLLEIHRENLVEQQFRSTFKDQYINSHIIIPFRNILAPDIGLPVIPEPNNAFHQPYDRAWLDRFFLLYTPSNIVDAVLRAVNDLPPKIPIESLTALLSAHAPDGLTARQFLDECWDDDGHLHKWAALYALQCAGVLARR